LTGHKWCIFCKEYFDRTRFGEHKKMHDRERNTDAVNQNQYTGQFKKNSGKDKDDYMICVLHQKKVPCPVKNCHYKPFGMIRKSYMIRCAKGIYDLSDTTKRCDPYFPSTDNLTGENSLLPIDMKTKTVTIMGVPIRLKI